MAARFDAARRILENGVAARAFPAAVAEAGTRTGPIWRHAAGRLTYADDAPPADMDTIFDLASLTKVMATTTLAMQAVERGALALDTRVSERLADWRGTDREMVTIGNLLEHASGLTAYLPFFRDHTGRREFERAICTMALEYPPRTQSIYSDLGFILLGFILEDAAGAPLERQFAALASALGPEPLAYNPPREWRARTAPTEVEAWRGRLLVGEVHDENAWALGGAAGHAGLFGTAGAVGVFARAVLETHAGLGGLARPETFSRFRTPSSVPGSSRALGWDTMRPTSSCGSRLSPGSIGHTGFTGTSLWIDPQNERYIVLLTNRVHPSRENEAIRALRPRLHDVIYDALESRRSGG
jgi:serine-type D-Ala-D-Ala carboxypeptidase